MMIIDDELDASLPLPTGERDIPLMIVDRSFDKRNQLTNPFGSGAHAPNDGSSAGCALVNGVHLPHLDVSAARYRVRILNAAQLQPLQPRALRTAPKMTQIATESGLMPAPVQRRRALIGPGERVEVVARLPPPRRQAGRAPQSAKRKGSGGLASKTHDGPLMEFRVGERADGHDQRPGERCGRCPAGSPTAPRDPDSASGSSRSRYGLTPTWLVNGKTFDPARSDAFPKLGTTETWELHNRTAVAHAIHMHSTDWYMLSRNGKQPPKPWEGCLKETFLLEPGRPGRRRRPLQPTSPAST